MCQSSSQSIIRHVTNQKSCLFYFINFLLSFHFLSIYVKLMFMYQLMLFRNFFFALLFQLCSNLRKDYDGFLNIVSTRLQQYRAIKTTTKMAVGVKHDPRLSPQTDFTQAVVLESPNVLTKALYTHVGKLRTVFRSNKTIEKNNFSLFWNNLR